MKLDIRQRNNLLTGVKLATELEPSTSGLRKFITIFGYTYDKDGRYESLKNILKPSLEEQVYFELRCYEIPIEYYDNHWDVTDDILVNDNINDDIKGIILLEKELKEYLQDFSKLLPSWNCDNII